MEDIVSLLKRIIQENKLIFSLFLLGLIFLGIGLIQLFSQPQREIEFTPGSTKAEQNSHKIYIDISGAVERPGVYIVPGDARIQDVLIAAGGLSGEADRDYVAKNINLAQRLTDGQKLYLPFVGEKVPENTVSQSGLISINSATLEELDSLSGVGKVTAQKIIDNRPYSSLDDLVIKKVVGRSTFEKMKNFISM